MLVVAYFVVRFATSYSSDGNIPKSICAHILQFLAVFGHLRFISPNASVIGIIVVFKNYLPMFGLFVVMLAGRDALYAVFITITVNEAHNLRKHI